MGIDLAEALHRRSRGLPGPRGQEVLTLSPASLEEVARESGLGLRSVEIRALQERLLPERYLRNLGTLGWEGQRRLLESCTAVIGCGGLGGHVVEGLARSGVGRLVLVDGDCFVPHNMNRQVLGTLDDLGRPKVEVARERVAAVNPAVEVVSHAVVATVDNLPALLQGVEVVVDALDTPGARLVLQDVAGRMEVPLVHGAIAGFIGQVTTVLPGDETLSLIYGGEAAPAHGAEFALGTPAPTPMLVAACQVAEVFKLLLGWGQLLRGQMLYLDLESGMVERFPILGGEG